MLGCVYNGGVQNLDGSFVMVWTMRKQHLRLGQLASLIECMTYILAKGRLSKARQDVVD
jgi:hypothetical protein